MRTSPNTAAIDTEIKKKKGTAYLQETSGRQGPLARNAFISTANP